jgi:putative lipoprotein (rSAM/lipoprotein system)
VYKKEKQMKKLALKAYGKAVTAILSLIGVLAGCSKPGGGIMAEYGTPSADFKAHGKVTNKETNQPVPDIRVIGKEFGQADTVYTDTRGNYTLDMKGIIGFPVKIRVDDVDGAKNGSLVSDSVSLQKKDVVQIKKGDGNWYDGAFEKDDADFALKPDKKTSAE